jgi:hypothetical protein
VQRARRARHDRILAARIQIRAISFDATHGRLHPRNPGSDREQGAAPAWVIEAQPYIDDPGADADIPPARRRSLLELAKGICKWPVGDPAAPDFFFCGAAAREGRPYCDHHCLRAYRAIAPNGRERGSPLMGLQNERKPERHAVAPAPEGGR